MRVLVGCEESGKVREAFRSRGHDAWSCDVLPSRIPGQHIQGDVLAVLNQHWDIGIFFPPCTRLCCSGARWFDSGKNREAQISALDFVSKLWNSPIEKVVIENPVGVLSSKFRQPSQIIHPWQYGHGETKSTCLWIRGLPLLESTNVVSGRVPRIHRLPPSPHRSMIRSETYQGIAEAMAEQWGRDNFNRVLF